MNEETGGVTGMTLSEGSIVATTSGFIVSFKTLTTQDAKELVGFLNQVVPLLERENR